MMIFLLKTVLISLLLTFTSLNLYAGVCDLSGSGIGGTGAPSAMDGGSDIGGTGTPVSKDNGSGIGGTGVIASDSGIGGTGQKTNNQATVIIGTITGFGSICVNGIEIHFDRSTPVQINGETTNTEQLALGQVVSVTVSGRGNEVIAQDIQVMNVVAGPIAEIDPNLNRVTVLGQQVHLQEKTRFEFLNTGASNLQKGDFIQVSGLRQANGDIIASRINSIIDKNTVHISGTAKNVSPTGFMIGGMSIDTDGSFTTKEGQEISVAGQIVADKLVLKQLTIPTLADNQRLRLEGFVHVETTVSGDIQIKIGHIAVETTEQMKNMLMTLNQQQPVIIDGTMKSEDTVKVDHLFIKDDIDKPGLQYIPQKIKKEHTHTKTNKQEQHEAEQNEKNDWQENKYEKLNRVENKELEKNNDETPFHETKTADVEANEREDSDSEKPEVEADEIEPVEKESSEVEAPKVETPEAEVPEVEAPKVETPEAEVPEVEAPELEAPETEVPEVEAPEVETPEAEVPEVEAPEVETPEAEVPEVEAPEVETPEAEVPEIEAPEVETPEAEVPEVEAPEVETPEAEVPEIEAPEVETPEAEMPEIEAPEVETPEAEVPEVEAPEVETP